MAQIFVAHSGRDADFVNFFTKCFYQTKVDPIFEEFERIFGGERSAPQIQADIDKANAIFVILSKNVESIRHTRDWVVSEAGASKGKDTWVFEPFSQLGSISVIIPFVRHYVLFATTEDWMRYIRMIIKFYDDSHVLPTTLLGTGIGTAADRKYPARGAIVGGIAGFILAKMSKPTQPTGLTITCNNCYSIYSVHIPQGVFRCPVCNVFLEIEEHIAKAPAEGD